MERYQNIADTDTDTDMRISPYTDTDTPILARFCSKFQVSNFISMLLSVAWLYSGRVKACIVTWMQKYFNIIMGVWVQQIHLDMHVYGQ